MKSKKNLAHLAAFVILTFTANNYLNAQVTIGTNKAPVGGALLQLKESESSNDQFNATKGLGMPRVNLTNIKPTTAVDLAKSIGNMAASYDLEQHMGLTIYNVKVPIFNPLTCEMEGAPVGLHVWDGSEWQSLVPEAPSEATGTIGTVTGISGTVYKTRVFGNAGEWMVENLRETAYELPETGTIAENRNDDDSETAKRYYYPANNQVAGGQHTGNIAHDKTLYLAHPEYGLLYTWAAASNNKVTDTFNSGSAGTIASTVQGICPNGWKLPSDKDWSDLEQEIANYPELYSSNAAGSTKWISAVGQGGDPNSDWRAVDGWRPNADSNGYGHGQSMKACAAADGSPIVASGKSTKTGFSEILVGGMNLGEARNYGIISYKWTSSINTANRTWVRATDNEHAGMYRSLPTRRNLYSIRCKKG